MTAGGRVPVWAVAVLLIAVHGVFFWQAFKQGWASDLPLHLEMVSAILETHAVPGNFLFYGSVAALAGFQDDIVMLERVTAALLAVAVGAKFVVSAAIALREVGGPQTSWREPPAAVLVILVGLLSFAFSLPTNEIYFGQLPPNVWHNSTTIFLMPFALLLFLSTAEFLRTGERRWLIASGIFAALNIAAKPSFVFAVLPVFSVLALLRFRRSRELWEASALTAFIGVLVLIQYFVIYKTGAEETLYRAMGFGEVDTQIGIDPFHVWSHFSTNIPLSLAASILFPLVALAIYRRRLLESDLVRYAWALLAASLAVFVLFTETGGREFQGNFAWQVPVSNYILFLVVLMRVWALRRVRLPRFATAAVWIAFAVHVLAGLRFLGYYYDKGAYF